MDLGRLARQLLCEAGELIFHAMQILMVNDQQAVLRFMLILILPDSFCSSFSMEKGEMKFIPDVFVPNHFSTTVFHSH
jgi:hypothetical protein